MTRLLVAVLAAIGFAAIMSRLVASLSDDEVVQPC